MSKCNCKVCRRGRKIYELANILRKFNYPNSADFLESLDLELEHAETELGRANAIIAGTWPDSDEIIKRAREPKDER